MRREVGCHQTTIRGRQPPTTIERCTQLISRALTMHGDFASVGTIALSIEVPFIFGCHDPHPLCVREVFFKAQLVGYKAVIVLTVGCD